MLRFWPTIIVSCYLATIVACYSANPPEWHLPQPQAGLATEWGSVGPGNHRCVPIPSTMEMCYSLGYPEMRLPNMLNHESAKEVQDQTAHWMPLVKTNCHPEIRVLLCSLYAPVCIQRLIERSIKPCRSLCQSVKFSCLAIMEKFGFSWPEMLNCTQFPPENDLMCIKRSVTQTEVSARSAHCQACVQEPSYESLISGYCMNDIVLKARIHPASLAPTPSAAAGRDFQFKGRLRFFSAPRQLIDKPSSSSRPLSKRQRRQQRRQPSLSGRLTGCGPETACPLLDAAAAHPKRRYLVMGSLMPDGATVDVKIIAEWANRRPEFRRALRSIRRDRRQRRGGGSGSGVCRGGATLLGLNNARSDAAAAAASAAVGNAGGRRRRNRRKGGGGGGRGGGRKKQKKRSDEAPTK